MVKSRKRKRAKRPSATSRTTRKEPKPIQPSHRRTARVQQLLKDLEDVHEGLSRWEQEWKEKDWDAIPEEQRDRIVIEHRERDELVIRLARLGVKDHPLVARRLSNLRLLGERDFLRKARLGLEKSVRRPLPAKDLRLWDEISQRRERGESWKEIQGALTREEVLRPMTRQAFHKIVTRLGLRYVTADTGGLREREIKATASPDKS